MNEIKILLADDDADDRDFFKEAITEANIEADITMMSDGEQLSEYLSATKDQSLPDVIFLDINMPKKNGKECLKEIRSNTEFNHIPVIMFSTSSHKKDIEETFNNGADFYIIKSSFFDNEVFILKQLFSEDWRKRQLKKSVKTYVLQAI